MVDVTTGSLEERRNSKKTEFPRANWDFFFFLFAMFYHRFAGGCGVELVCIAAKAWENLITVC